MHRVNGCLQRTQLYMCDTLNVSFTWGFLKVKIKHKNYIAYEYMIDSDRRLLLKSASTVVIISSHGQI